MDKGLSDAFYKSPRLAEVLVEEERDLEKVVEKRNYKLHLQIT